MENSNTLHNDLPLHYMAFTAAELINKPLIILLHGYGSNEEDLFGIRNDLIEGYTYLSVRAPMTIRQGSYQWFSLQMPLAGTNEVFKQIQNHTKILEDFIIAASKKYKTSSENIILIGFSQGAIMSYELALKSPTSVKGIAALSGRISPSLLSEITPSMNLENLSIFIGHGTKDDRISVKEAITANDILTKTSITPEFHTYEGLGHSISEDELNDIRQWLLKTLTMI